MSSNPQDEVFVVNFGEEYYLDQDFTDDVAKLKVALDRVETWGSTALYDAIVASAAHITQDAKIQKRVLLVVTDGKDKREPGVPRGNRAATATGRRARSLRNWLC
jgi:Ca-activated chloride channel homolog